jgi:outer membrane lipoprotein-sorting protein
MRKPVILWIALLMSLSAAQSQRTQNAQDPAAGTVLERVAAKFATLKSLQSNFELIVSDRKENTKNTSAGSLLMKHNMYKLESEGNTVYFNGTTMWTYDVVNNEVTITEPKNETGNFLGNPSRFFTTYQQDFKYRYVGETTMNGLRCHEIDLFPKDLNQPYSRIKVFINTLSDLPVIITSIGKDGVDYTVSLKDLITDREITDATFTFDPAKHKKVEVVDMRGL